MVKFVKKILKSHKIAIRGILKVYKTELTFRVQFWWGVIVLTQTFYWPIGEIKQLILVLVVFLMLLSEILNTTFEKLFDFMEQRYNTHIGYLKDILAGGVLLMAITSVAIGIMIFWPYITQLIIFSILESIGIVILIYGFRLVKKMIKK